MQAHLAKYRKLMPALALLFSLADGNLTAVSMHHTQLAADWCEYLEAHANRVYASQCSPQQYAAITLGGKLSAGWQRSQGAFTLREVYGNCWTGLSTPDEARAALQVLETYGWVRKADHEDGARAGRPAECYEINPRIEGRHASN